MPSASEAFDDHVALVAASRTLAPQLDAAGRALGAAFLAGRRCAAFGTGGSASDASHFVAELVGCYDGPGRALPAVALTADGAVVSSIGNDLGFDDLFARQVEAHVGPGDVVVAITTSGRSQNVLRAVEVATARGAVVITLTGAGGQTLADRSDVGIVVPSTDTQRVQEVHGLCLHAIVAAARAVVAADG